MKNIDIIATIGPASESVEVLREMIQAGMTVTRSNFSHGEFSWHQGILANVREAAAAEGADIKTLQDLAGIKIRVSGVEKEILVEKGQKIYFGSIAKEGYLCVGTSYEKLSQDVKVGEPMYIDENEVRLIITEVGDGYIAAEVTKGGYIRKRKGINFPDSDLTFDFPTEKDIEDIIQCGSLGYDYVALSFVRDAADIKKVRGIFAEHGIKSKIISKIESKKAIENIDEIIAESDGIMIARGDMGVEVGIEKVPMIQREILKKCEKAGKYVIVATQVIESMRESLVPTRAEVTDIFYAVYEGADAVMLSAESATGKYPVDSVRVMRIVIEQSMLYKNEEKIY